MSKDLNPEKALIFRIVHLKNLAILLDGGMRCQNSKNLGAYFQIGNPELIARRPHRAVPCGPGGTLSDYVPFYFTPYTPMLYNIKTGHNGIERQNVSDILIFVASLHTLKKQNVPFVFSDRHAYLKTALFSSDLNDLSRINWAILQERDFRKSDIDRFERYQAEALVHKRVPFEALSGIVCYTDSVATAVKAELSQRGLTVKVLAQPQWYL